MSRQVKSLQSLRIFFHFFDVGVNNAEIIYRNLKGTETVRVDHKADRALEFHRKVSCAMIQNISSHQSLDKAADCQVLPWNRPWSGKGIETSEWERCQLCYQKRKPAIQLRTNVALAMCTFATQLNALINDEYCCSVQINSNSNSTASESFTRSREPPPSLPSWSWEEKIERIISWLECVYNSISLMLNYDLDKKSVGIIKKYDCTSPTYDHSFFDLWQWLYNGTNLILQYLDN